jgi:7-cyano-7-deazaguanine synthase in queuosine biosynthesis
MPAYEHLVLCGGADATPKASARSLRLNLRGTSANVRLHISDIGRRLLANIPDVLTDLLEVATYVYAADGAISRGGKTDAQMGARWRRRMRLVLPVRQPELWSSDPIASVLIETLTFLSEDSYAFEFRPLVSPPGIESYFDFADVPGTAFRPDEVILFSGGLDSLAGAVDKLAHGRKVALVSHRSASKIAGAQKLLVEQMRQRFGADNVRHVPVWANLDGTISHETTHRTRSFLFVALATVAARLFKLDRIGIYENGVVSLNLPPVGQVVGARATRTTHPQALAGFRSVLSALLGRDFDVNNPFAWLTKRDIVGGIASNGCAEFIRNARSCTRVHDMTKLHPHCGQCSQCLDRRFAVLAAGQEDQDPGEAYKVDLLLGERPAGPDREMALAYVRSASKIRQMGDVAFFARYGEVSRVVGYFKEPAGSVAERILDLYQRHASAICQAFDTATVAHVSALREGTLPADCLLSLVVGQHGAPSEYPVPVQEVDDIVSVRTEIRLAIDEEGERVVFPRWGDVTGECARLLIVLAQPFRAAARDERAPENYPFTHRRELQRQINCDSEGTLRRRILRCRNTITKMACNAGDAAPSIDAVIENHPWHGYRLSPEQVRIVAVSELPPSR